jgi:hypothetical protein
MYLVPDSGLAMYEVPDSGLAIWLLQRLSSLQTLQHSVDRVSLCILPWLKA